MSDNRDDILALINQQERPAGVEMGSCRWEDRGAYQAPQTIRKEGHVRLAQPAVINTGYGPTIVAPSDRHTDGRVKEMPGLPAFERVRITSIDGEE